jgi:beta-aspartyl-peptidase (threonine type)
MLLIVASTNGSVGIREAMRTLKAGMPAVDAVEIGIRAVEDNADDHGVGRGGYPNLLGEAELDAAIISMGARWPQEPSAPCEATATPSPWRGR